MLILDYDIRGIFKKELNFEIIYYTVNQFFKKINDRKIILGVDSNKNNLIIKEFLLKNFAFEYLGILSTPIFYYQVIKRKKPGIMITASHLPKNYSGLKFLLANGESWKPKIKTQNLKLSNYIQIKTIKKQKTEKDNFQKEINPEIYQEYFEKLKKIVKPKKKVFVNFDKKNFFLHFSLPYFKKLNIFDNNNSLMKIKSDLDNDRIFVYYQNKMILPDLVFYYLAINKKYKNLGVPIYFSQYLKEKLLKLNKKIFIIPTGHYYFKKAYKKYNLDLAFEPSGHFYMFKDLKTESPYLTLAIFLQQEIDLKFLSFVNKNIKRLSLKIDEKFDLEKFVSSLKKKFKLKLKKFDGYLLYQENFYLHLRKSKTENKLRISFEGDQKFAKEIINATRTFN